MLDELRNHTKYTSPKVNTIMQLEFELAYNDVVARHVSHYTTGIPLYECMCELIHKVSIQYLSINIYVYMYVCTNAFMYVPLNLLIKLIISVSEVWEASWTPKRRDVESCNLVQKSNFQWLFRFSLRYIFDS